MYNYTIKLLVCPYLFIYFLVGGFAENKHIQIKFLRFNHDHQKPHFFLNNERKVFYVMHGSLVNVPILEMKQVIQIYPNKNFHLFSHYFIWIICFLHSSIHSMCQKSNYCCYFSPKALGYLLCVCAERRIVYVTEINIKRSKFAPDAITADRGGPASPSLF